MNYLNLEGGGCSESRSHHCTHQGTNSSFRLDPIRHDHWACSAVDIPILPQFPVSSQAWSERLMLGLDTLLHKYSPHFHLCCQPGWGEDPCQGRAIFLLQPHLSNG